MGKIGEGRVFVEDHSLWRALLAAGAKRICCAGKEDGRYGQVDLSNTAVFSGRDEFTAPIGIHSSIFSRRFTN
jgi:hypothetical protein